MLLHGEVFMVARMYVEAEEEDGVIPRDRFHHFGGRFALAKPEFL